MNKLFLEQTRKLRMTKSRVSESDLADFLDQLATLYSPTTYGNPDLSSALKQLAAVVRQGGLKLPLSDQKRDRKNSKLTAEELSDLQSLDIEAVKSFLADSTRTKRELLALASARFSMPTSQLDKLRTEEVRAAVTSALLHESSIEIISNEADKDGAQRTS